MTCDDLSLREREILRCVVKQFILTALPVGSRFITKKYDVGFSPATVRNIMSDLELMGYINHPHTSAGRIPTDKGYRLYVDSLMDIHSLENFEKENIHRGLENFTSESSEFLPTASKLLSNITNLLACVVYPDFETGILEKIQIVRLSSKKILVVVSIDGGMVRTITFELDSEIKEDQIHYVELLLNEKLSGLSLIEIKKTFAERFADSDPDSKPLLNIVFKAVSKIFKDIKLNDKISISGARNLIKQPEFEQADKFDTIVELIEERDVIVHIFQSVARSVNNSVNISIGKEIDNRSFEDYSLVLKEYKIGGMSGTLGIVGPKRMEYGKIVAIVDYTAKMLTDVFNKNS